MDAYSLGQYLREAREALEIEIEDAVAKLRIRQPILEAFEDGEYDIRGVPEIQVRGMLRIYARFLELDEEHTLLLFDQMRFAQEKGRRVRLRRRGRRQEDAEQRVESATQPLQEMQLSERRSSGCRGVIRVCLILLLSLLALGVIIFVSFELLGLDIGEEAPPPVDTTSLPATNTQPPAPTATATFFSPTPSNRAQFSGSGILVSLLATQRSWLSIYVDGTEQFTGIAAPDTLFEYSAISEVTLSAANALALDLIWNGQQQGTIGGRGQRVDMRFTAAEVTVNLGPAGAPTLVSPTVEPTALPTVAFTPLPSNTPGPSPTLTESPIPSETPNPTATVTPLPSDTPLPSATPTVTDTPPPTAILPPRVTQAGLPPTKAGV